MESTRPRGELFSDATTDVVWAAVRALDEGAQHELLGELRKRLAHPREDRDGHGERVARATAALREAAEMLGGRSPSVTEYRDLRHQNPERDWPPDGSVRRWLGGNWNGALERARLDRVPEHLTQVRELGSRLTADEVLAGIRACAEEIGSTPTFQQYLSWARRPDVRRRPGRRAQSQGPIQRLFGGWLEALVAAGFVRDDGTGAARAEDFGRGYRYTDEPLMVAMHEVTERYGEGRLPSAGNYSRIRDEIREVETAAGLPPRAFPSFNVLQRRFGRWCNARHEFERWQAERNGTGSEASS